MKRVKMNLNMNFTYIYKRLSGERKTEGQDKIEKLSWQSREHEKDGTYTHIHTKRKATIKLQTMQAQPPKTTI